MRAGPVLLATLALTACSRDDGVPARAEGAEHVACALGQGAPFAEVCAVERAVQDGRQVLVVRHPDGGFRRFVVEPDGRGVSAADGAEAPRIAVAGNLLEVSAGPDRYRFPFTVKPDDAR